MFFLTLMGARRSEARIGVALVGVFPTPTLMQRLADVVETSLKATCPVKTGALRARLRVYPSIGGTLRVSGLVYLASTHWRGRSSGWIDRGLAAAQADANARLALFGAAMGRGARPVRSISGPVAGPPPRLPAPLRPETAAVRNLPPVAGLPRIVRDAFAAAVVYGAQPPPPPPLPPYVER